MPAEAREFSFIRSEAPRPVRWLKHLPNPGYCAAFSPGVKGPRRKANHSALSSAELKNVWTYTCIFHVRSYCAYGQVELYKNSRQHKSQKWFASRLLQEIKVNFKAQNQQVTGNTSKKHRTKGRQWVFYTKFYLYQLMHLFLSNTKIT